MKKLLRFLLFLGVAIDGAILVAFIMWYSEDRSWESIGAILGSCAVLVAMIKGLLAKDQVGTNQVAFNERFATSEGGPKANDIISHIKSLPPFQQKLVGKTYIGNKVTWKVFFYSIEQTGDNFDVSTFVARNTRLLDAPALVHFKVKAEDYPEFQVAKRDAPFLVSGKIVSAGTSAIELDVAFLKSLSS